MDMWVPWRLGVLSFDIALLTAAEQNKTRLGKETY